MCTSIVSNRKETLVGWNLDIIGMKHKVVCESERAYIAVYDETEGWLPLFGANARGDFVAMPTCWPHDKRSDPTQGGENNIIKLNIDLLLGNRNLDEIKEIAEKEKICSIPGVTFQSQLSDGEGNVLQIVPGQGTRYLKKPTYSVMTNFSPFKGDSEKHPYMGHDRYLLARQMLQEMGEEIDVKGMFEILKSTAQSVCPTVVSMVYHVEERTVYWCEGQEWNNVKKHVFFSTNEAQELNLNLADDEWPLDYVDHDREIVRAVVIDDQENFYFVRADRDDIFGRATTIETAGGGVEKGENLKEAIKRELLEELGAEVEVICKIGLVSDYYNLIHRHNLNNYFLCKVKSFSKRHLTDDEKNKFHLSTLKLSYEEAIREYEKNKSYSLGRLIANREMPILKRAKEIIDKTKTKNEAET